MDDLKKRIGELSYKVTQEDFTEKPFTGKYNDHFEKGIYVDIVGGEVLFSSKDKFKSMCGWPSFSKTIDEDNVAYRKDNKLSTQRTEVRSKKSDSHLGHVFNDGPKELGGKRYCINSSALKFIPYEDLEDEGYEEYKTIFED